jgi:concanavalin A-like lectin/glucanase superfamily protein
VTLRSLWLTAALLAPACGFTAPASDDVVDPGPDPTPDPTVARKCALKDPTLKLCIDFDDPQSLTGDGSGLGHDASGSGFAVMTRGSEQAVSVDATSRLTVAETPDLDITTNLTFSLWARPDRAPTGPGSFWALDNNKQYYVSYQANGKFRCGIGATTIDAFVGVPSDNWYHVACTFDQAEGKLRVYVNGQPGGCRTVTGVVPTDGHDGLAIGANHGGPAMFTDQFQGGLDNIQVFARTFSDDEVCSAAGQKSCWDGC